MLAYSTRITFSEAISVLQWQAEDTLRSHMKQYLPCFPLRVWCGPDLHSQIRKGKGREKELFQVVLGQTLCEGSLKQEQNIFFCSSPTPSKSFFSPMNRTHKWLNLENARRVTHQISLLCIHSKAICLIAKRPFLFSWIGRGVGEEEKKKRFQGKCKPCKEEIMIQVKLKFRVCWKTSV